ncbi:C2H2 type zinc finger domain protein [Aspergillus nomiae NRRL 13137]|uniref:C2H2 type zinc finger domain protein n=1 Tax=Aspergillus nomiae NRRL (strain ATCC 15546 / NRRL 13137 / CBS 260.88 / M93) TaxID=1509407 RepID=A0A0L1IYK0_ASPN3|nr:C2H2 type zinc finger domain protein [Aspergillus nomiae NRRL 13137]KNG84582.1 C2H2 type zinc finger domain protein [Aspergillus nomiae NRRL 13137]
MQLSPSGELYLSESSVCYFPKCLDAVTIVLTSTSGQSSLECWSKSSCLRSLRTDIQENGTSGTAHTKEKPYVCFCGAAFTRRDLLKRHTRITHENNLISPTSQSQQEATGQSIVRRTPDPPVTQPYNVQPAPRPDIPLVPPPMGQWSGPQHGPYLEQSQSMLNAGGNSSGLGPHPAVTHDADILQAAQLLLPGSFRDAQPPPQPLPYLPEELNHFQEFTHFLDSIGLPSEWVPALREVPQGTSRRSQAERSRADSPFRSWLPSVPSEDQSLGTVSDYEPPQHSTKVIPPRVSEEQRLRLAASLEEHRHLIPDFVLPSRHTLTRYLTSFFDGFHPHLPYLHLPTLRINERAPELVLALMTIGAQYRFEHRNAERLFYASKAIVLHKLSKETHAPLATYNGIIQIPLDSIRELSQQTGQATALSPSENDLGMIAWRQIETIRTLLTLMGYATWEKSELVQEAFSLQGLLVRCLREFGLTENITVAPRHSPMQWHEWAEEESIRRTRFISFCFVHVHSIAYNIYPVLRSSEVHLRLPCSTKEWKATTAQEWELAQKEVGAQQLFFQDALALLLQPSRTTVLLDPIPAPLGNYILLHGLLQRIHLVSELSLPTGDQALALPTEELNKLERALRSWTSVWQQAPESSLDPHNDNGPIPFTSSSLLGLAYVRLSLNLGPYRQLETRDPYRIASALHRSPRPGRSYRLTPALIYSAHALSIPVRLGIDHVARSQAFFWSVRHSIASLECAVLLSKWLLSLAETGTDQNLSDNESRILNWTRCIVEEAYSSMDLEDWETVPSLDPASLGLAVIKLWSRLFRKNTQWPFINVLGESLEKYLTLIRPG